MKRTHQPTRLRPVTGIWPVWASQIGPTGVATIALVLATAGMGLAAPGDPGNGVREARSSTAANMPDDVPVSLRDVGEHGELVYDAAKVRDWSKTTADLAKLKAAAQRLRMDLRESPDELAEVLAELEAAVTTKDKQATMRQANRVTLTAANMTVPFHPAVPPEVIRLDYLGRELEIWAEAKDASKLHTTAADLTRTWESVRPAVESRGATALSKEFTDLVTRVRSARSPNEFRRLASRVLEAVDRLESVFRK